MSGKNDDNVLTPGGRRPASDVHAVAAGDAVHENDGGSLEVAEWLVATGSAGPVLTPGGYRDPRLVHRVLPNHALDASGLIARQFDLTTKAYIETSEFEMEAFDLPRFTSGWIAYACWTNMTGQPVTLFRTTWRVPKAPTTDSGQTIFLFNGIDPIDPSRAILQPVLQWGRSAAGGGSYWSIASWYVAGGVAFHTTLKRVNEGDELVGVMRIEQRHGVRFNYSCEFEGITSTTLPVHNIEELVWFNQTLEAYEITQCSDYPASDVTAMYAIELKSGGVAAPFTWERVVEHDDCGQRVDVTADGVVEIRYRS